MYSPILRNTMNNETQALSTTTTTKNKTKTKSSSGVKGQINNKEEKQRRRQARN